jgi:hypothetical protein
MNKTRNLVEMGEFYASTILTEAKTNFPPKDTFKLSTDKKIKPAEANKKAFASSPSGPAEADNVKTDIIDAKNSKTKKDNFYEPEKFSQENGKIQKENINTFMNKSIFDRLYEDVMSDNINSPADIEQADAEALELPGTEVEEGEVTITLDRELAQKLHDVLMSVLGSEEEVPETEEEGAPEEGEISDEAAEEEVEEEDEESDVQAEATELTALPDSKGKTLQSKANKVHGAATSLVSKGHGEGKIKDENDAEGTVLPDSKGKTLQSKSNKVNSKTSKVGSYLAGLK